MAKRPSKPADRRAKKSSKAPATAADDMRVTSIHIPRDLLSVLRIAAVNRADRAGGRPSVSAVVVDVLRRHQAEIEAM